jgi:ABC-type transport system substrate-binding protein
MAVFTRYPVRYLDIIRENAGDLEPALILAVIMAESSFRENAESHRGARGLMQLMPATAEEIARHMGIQNFRPEDVWRPEINIAMGSFYLNRLYRLFGCTELALAAYNAGQGNVQKWLSDPDISNDGKKLDDIPFSETRNYIKRVNSNQRIYNMLLNVTGRNTPYERSEPDGKIFADYTETYYAIELEPPLDTPAAANDGILRLHMRPPMTLNPLLNEDVTAARILRLIFEPLAVLDNEFRAAGYLADLEFASDFGSVNATIREGALWSDGMPVTADDVIFSIDFLRRAPQTVIYKNVIENIADAIRIDTRTVQIVFERASVQMAEYSLNFPIIPQHYYHGETNRQSVKNMNPLGSGPFVLEEHTPVRSLTLRRNTLNYRSKIEQIEVTFLPDADTDFHAFERGRIDALHLPLTEWTRRRGVRSPVYEVFPSMYFEFIGFNYRRNIFRDVHTRQGIAHAFNAHEAVSRLYLAHAVYSLTPIHPHNWAASEINIIYDPARAAALLGTVRIHEPLVIIASENNSQRASIARQLAASLSDTGLAATAEIIPQEEYFERIAAHDYDLYIGGMKLPFAPDTRVFFRASELFLHDPLLENAHTALTFASTETTYIQSMHQLQQTFAERLPVIGLGFTHSALLTNPRITSDLNPAPDHVFANVHEWSF